MNRIQFQELPLVASDKIYEENERLRPLGRFRPFPCPQIVTVVVENEDGTETEWIVGLVDGIVSRAKKLD